MANSAGELLRQLRKDYTQATLDESGVDRDPIRQFHRWFDEALEAQLPEPHAMTLATASADGIPSARIVLLRGADSSGFSFFTNYDSRKGRDIEANPRAALVFHWHDLERQIRIEGSVEKVSEGESDDYFQSRPHGSKVGAWASPQSLVIPNRAALERKFQEVEQRFPDGKIPRPPHWGGYRVIPESIEFWQGRASRLHDRVLYRKQADGGWTIERLSP
jgi:pyridoxamine 5'-phosphate oxidase